MDAQNAVVGNDQPIRSAESEAVIGGLAVKPMERAHLLRSAPDSLPDDVPSGPDRTARLAQMEHVAAGIAHEMATPLNVIMGRTESLLSRGSPDEGVAKGLAVILAEAEYCAGVMKQLLLFARRYPSKPQLLDLEQAVERSLVFLGRRLEAHRIRMEKRWTGLSPVQADPHLLHQTLENVLLNAVQAMPEGGVLRIAGEPVGPWVRLKIGDTGSGMTDAQHATLFEPFASVTLNGRGAGLGLAVAHGIVTAHGGRIDAASDPEGGTTVTIWWPLIQDKICAES